MTKGPNSRNANAKGVPFSMNPVLALKLSAWRSRLVMFALFIGFVALICRAFWLQAVSTDFLQKQGESRYARTLELPATRGKITDRNGLVLASSVPVKAIWAIPEDVLAEPKEKIQQLAVLLEMSEADLRKKLDSDRQFVYLKRQVEQATADKIVALNLSGIQTRKEYKRFYPEGEAMAHVVGFTNVEDAGQEGMELAEQASLAGKLGSRRVIKDRLGRIVEDLRAVNEPHDGKELVLSIDSKIQYLAYAQLKETIEKFKAKAGGVVVIDVQTGEILALANLPSYNPNQRSELTGAQLRNRVMTDAYEPGSVMKPFTVSLALETNRVTPETVFQTAGRMTIGTATIGDAHESAALTVAQIIEKSSNIGTAKIALEMPAQEMWEMFTKVGFGQAPKFNFPGTATGRLRNYKTWKPIEQATMSYGHGLTASTIQLAHAYTIFARDGELIPLSLQKVSQPPVGERIISAKTAQTMRMMLETVTGPGGSAIRARVPGYRVAGKTGTAYKVEHGQYVKKYIASFCGFAPVSNPRIIVAVMVDEPDPSIGHYGGTVAAPLFSSITANALRTLNVPPDTSVTSVLPDNGLGDIM
ncbi:peptidoglycan D,D-transpeptidase FtsI family protein [Solimicrobium silvestre]|uniref:Peptidoglycan D,D-transpeptidase FtsI n=1 Tax=Solimicrobium silvestre TaxID=2099400 RepID=A0A2S9H5E4_9BURK|nr:penicillin-binding protein 2 [Solimicrobium silvestre]PRC95210.1 Cell division protein FtsI/penicillin-binding protein 2 [Solimicrobium silvestre]